MVVTMELIPNQSLIQSIKQKKKQKNQLSQQSIERLYKGISPCQLNKKKKHICQRLIEVFRIRK